MVLFVDPSFLYEQNSINMEELGGKKKERFASPTDYFRAAEERKIAVNVFQ